MKIIYVYLLVTLLHFPVKSFSLNDLKNELNLTADQIDIRGRQEIAVFEGLWEGGYYEGDPLDPKGNSTFHYLHGALNLNPLYVCYYNCIKPFVNKTIDVLEIGPGRGAWTKAILFENPKTVVCVDAVSAEQNKFWEYIGKNDKVSYYKVSDFSLDCLKDDSIDYVFSFGVFCHISPVLISEYLKNLYPKLRKGAKCFIHYADYDKKNIFAKKFDMLNHIAGNKEDILLDFLTSPQGKWYHLGCDLAEKILIELGYEVINIDTNLNERDPIMYFIKP